MSEFDVSGVLGEECPYEYAVSMALCPQIARLNEYTRKKRGTELFQQIEKNKSKKQESSRSYSETGMIEQTMNSGGVYIYTTDSIARSLSGLGRFDMSSTMS